MATKLDNQYTPGGRLVMGSLIEKGSKDYDGNPISADKQRYFFGVAVPKDAPGVADLINAIWTMAATDYAQVPLVMQQINMGLAARDFAWKIQDGDVVQYDKKTGQPKPIPDYIAGCYVFKFSTMFEIGACDANGVEIGRGDIKNGDYVDVMFNTTINEKMDDTAGIYLNPVAIRRLGFGAAIASSISASAAFADRAAVAPPGATQMPTAPAGGMPGAGMPQQGMPQQGMPQQGMPQPPQGTPQQGTPQQGMPQGNPQPPQGMPGAGAPAHGGMASAGAPQGMPGAMPTTASHGNATVPHMGILQGPAGGMPGTGQ